MNLEIPKDSRFSTSLALSLTAASHCNGLYPQQRNGAWYPWFSDSPRSLHCKRNLNSHPHKCDGNPLIQRDSGPPVAFLDNEMRIPVKEEENHEVFCRSKSSSKLKKLVPKVLRTNSMKNLFKSKKPRAPGDVVRETRDLLSCLNSGSENAKRDEKLEEQLDTDIRELKTILYGINESEPQADACAQVTQEFFKDGTMRLLIRCLPKLHLETRKDATQVVANLQRQPVHSRLIASDYLETNLDLIDQLITGYEDPVLALHFGGMLKECIRHQVVARYVLKSEHMKKFLDYIQLPNFDVASDAAATFKELMTRHKSTVAGFLAENQAWFFSEFNSKLLESSNYMTRRQAVKLLGEILLERSNASVMIRYVSSKNSMRVLMNLMRESHKSIQIDAFHVFKLFVANQNKPRDIVNILCANKSKLLRFFDGFNTDKEDEMFEADKAQVVKEISELEPLSPFTCSGELFKPIAV